MKQALHISTTGNVIELDLTTSSLATLQAAVDGLIEAVPLANDLTMWCNEEGKLLGLPHNPFGQFMWDKVFGAHTDYIVGDIVLSGGTDSEGEAVGLTEEQREIIKQIIRRVQEFIEPRTTVLEWA
jgi:hypothetical protein